MKMAWSFGIPWILRHTWEAWWGDGGYHGVTWGTYGVAKMRLGDLVLERVVIWNTSF